MKKHFLSAFVISLAAISSALAYGPEGHQTVGAIADRLLADTPTGAKVSALLDGYTLREVSIIPDTIKQWDKKGADDPTVDRYFSSHPKIAEQLRAFWKANPPNTDEKSPIPSHHWFHYTDVPLVDPPEKYRDGKAGRSQWDIVHMMSYCIAVLRGEEPETNARGITKPIAIILLAHFVGDIHQPLHVGAEYFDANGKPANPDKSGEIFPDEGGNSLHLELNEAPPPNASKHPKLHGFWDSDTVFANLPELPDTMPKEERRAKMDLAENDLAQELAKKGAGQVEIGPRRAARKISGSLGGRNYASGAGGARPAEFRAGASEARPRTNGRRRHRARSLHARRHCRIGNGRARWCAVNCNWPAGGWPIS